MKNNDFDQIITEAINWWIEKIENPNNFDNGDDSKEGQMANILAMIQATKQKEKISKEQIEVFRESLTEELEEALSLRGECILRTDYDPMWQLKSAAAVARIDDSVFPWKTIMKINKDKVIVSEGYKKPYKTIYEVKEVNKIKKI